MWRGTVTYTLSSSLGCSMNVAQLDAALSHPVRDFEDMMQYLCAKAANCDVIVTNNKRDFEEFSDLPVMTAGEFLKSFEEDN